MNASHARDPGRNSKGRPYVIYERYTKAAIAKYYAELLLEIYDKQNQQLQLVDAYKKLRKCCSSITYKGKDVIDLNSCLTGLEPGKLAK